MFESSDKGLSYHSVSFTGTFFQLFIIVHIREYIHWILTHVNTKKSRILIYDSIKLNIWN